MSSEFNETNFNKIKEGKAHVYFNKVKNQVFYNPIQEFNRDLSIAVLNTYSKTNGDKQLRILEALAASGIGNAQKYAQSSKAIILTVLDM